MSKFVVSLFVLFLAGCSAQISKPRHQQIDIVVVSLEQEKVRITYLEHNLLHTVYVADKICNYDIGPSTLKIIDGSIVISPNSRCSYSTSHGNVFSDHG